MTYTEFVSSLQHDAPPSGIPPVLRALWHEAHGDWDRAHEIVQGEKGTDAARVHAYLHRKEGDLYNAFYWYCIAGKARATITLEKEWQQIVRDLLA
jgi:hypothetical protein